MSVTFILYWQVYLELNTMCFSPTHKNMLFYLSTADVKLSYLCYLGQTTGDMKWQKREPTPQRSLQWLVSWNCNVCCTALASQLLYICRMTRNYDCFISIYNDKKKQCNFYKMSSTIHYALLVWFEWVQGSRWEFWTEWNKLWANDFNPLFLCNLGL